MRSALTLVLLFLAACCMAACARAPRSIQVPVAPDKRVSAVQPSGTAPSTLQGEAEPTVMQLPTAAETPYPTQSPAASKTPQPAPTWTPSATPTSTPDPFRDLTIVALASRSYGGGELTIVDTVEQAEHFARYLIEYPSDGLTIAGFMNVPHEGSKFPVAIVLHGYIPPEEYETVAYTRRYADALAEAGYFVIHPNLRNYPPSDSGPNEFRTGMAVDVLNLIAIIEEQSQDPLGTLRRANAEDINLWGHSMGGGVALRVIAVNNDEAIRTAVLYGATSGDEALNYARIRARSGGERGGRELSVSEETLAALSPINYLDRINAAISIHHSDADSVVPLEWSEDLCARLEARQHEVECFTYHGAPHTFNTVWDELFIERTINFLDRH